MGAVRVGPSRGTLYAKTAPAQLSLSVPAPALGLPATRASRPMFICWGPSVASNADQPRLAGSAHPTDRDFPIVRQAILGSSLQEMRGSKFSSDHPSFTKETPSDAQLGVASNEVNRRNCWYDWATGCVGGCGDTLLPNSRCRRPSRWRLLSQFSDGKKVQSD